MCLPSAIWPNIRDAKNVLWRMGILLKKLHNILLYDAGQFYVNNKMAAE